MTKTVAVIGATGLQGSSVLKTLHATPGYRVRGVTRRPGGEAAQALAAQCPDAEWVQGDLNDAGSLAAAFRGADVVFGVTDFFQPDVLARVAAGDQDAEFAQGRNIVDAAIAARVALVVWSGLPSAARLSGGKYPGVLHFEGKHRVAEYLRSKSGQIDGLVVHVGFYMENYTRFARLSPETGDGRTVEFAFPLRPDTRLPLTDTASDVGPVVRHMLAHPDQFRGAPAVVVSGGDRAAREMAAAFTEATGRPARFVQIPYDALGSDELAQMFRFLDEFGYFGHDAPDTSNAVDGYSFTTPLEFWKRRGWTGPVQPPAAS
ncbi:hypothetical protein H4R18_005111 [Coemansia javaensis]|uniref:NmrA-like domain-containing protein n=1 Tax=Coemansia javaensis TaxID=2761396 RepID=A0A9W8LFC2_9FUNG|nr:hypothetical protein H4R18_005111 [Coemansia javaensis]